MTATRFPIRVGERSRLLLRVFFGVTPHRAWATIDEHQVTARLGWWQIQVPTADITRWRIEGPWRWITAIGVRRSIRHGDVSFAGSPRGGVRLDLRAPVRWTLFRVPALYLGVDDLEGFAEVLAGFGIAGEDARARAPAARLKT
jgi:hypothetical protein